MMLISGGCIDIGIDIGIGIGNGIGIILLG